MRRSKNTSVNQSLSLLNCIITKNIAEFNTLMQKSTTNLNQVLNQIVDVEKDGIYYSGANLLFCAVLYEFDLAVTILLLKDLDVSAQAVCKQSKETAFTLALKALHSGYLMQMFGVVDLRSAKIENESVLHYLCTHSRKLRITNSDPNFKKRFFEILIKKGNFNLNAVNGQGKTGIRLLCENGEFDIIDSFIEKGEIVKREDLEILSVNFLDLFDQSNPKEFSLLIQKLQKFISIYPNIVRKKSHKDQSPLHKAVIAQNLACVKKLIDLGADPNLPDVEGDTPIHCAAANPSSEILSVLLTKADKIEPISNEGMNPVRLASQHMQVRNMDLLTRHYFDLPLIHWTINGISNSSSQSYRLNIYKIIELAAKIFDINLVHRVKNYELSPLHQGVLLHDRELVLFLLKNNANLNLKGWKGNTPLHFAAQEGQVEIISDLIEHGALLEATTNQGFTPVTIAVDKGFKTCVALLLAKGANSNPLMSDPSIGKTSTPLIQALFSRKVDIAKMILQCPTVENINFYQKGDSFYFSAIIVAVRENYHEIVTLLMEKDVSLHNIYPDSDISIFVILVLLAISRSSIKSLKIILQSLLHNKNIIDENFISIAINYAFELQHLEILTLLSAFKIHQDKIILDQSTQTVSVSAQENPLLTTTSPKILDTSSTLVEENPPLIAPLKISESPTQISESHIFSLPENKNTSTTMSARSFLRNNLKMSDEEINELCDKNKKRAQDKRKKIEKYKNYNFFKEKMTWLHGTVDLQEKFAPIQGGTNCYFYLSKDNVLLDDQALLDKFQAVRPKFGDHLKKLSPIPANIQINNEPICEIRFTHELRLPNRIERLLVFPLLSDTKRHTLYIAGRFEGKGLHTTKDKKCAAQKTSVINITLPVNEKKTKTECKVELL